MVPAAFKSLVIPRATALDGPSNADVSGTTNLLSKSVSPIHNRLLGARHKDLKSCAAVEKHSGSSGGGPAPRGDRGEKGNKAGGSAVGYSVAEAAEVSSLQEREGPFPSPLRKRKNSRGTVIGGVLVTQGGGVRNPFDFVDEIIERELPAKLERAGDRGSHVDNISSLPTWAQPIPATREPILGVSGGGGRGAASTTGPLDGLLAAAQQATALQQMLVDQGRGGGASAYGSPAGSGVDNCFPPPNLEEEQQPIRRTAGVGPLTVTAWGGASSSRSAERKQKPLFPPSPLRPLLEQGGGRTGSSSSSWSANHGNGEPDESSVSVEGRAASFDQQGPTAKQSPPNSRIMYLQTTRQSPALGVVSSPPRSNSKDGSSSSLQQQQPRTNQNVVHALLYEQDSTLHAKFEKSPAAFEHDDSDLAAAFKTRVDAFLHDTGEGGPRGRSCGGAESTTTVVGAAASSLEQEPRYSEVDRMPPLGTPSRPNAAHGSRRTPTGSSSSSPLGGREGATSTTFSGGAPLDASRVLSGTATEVARSSFASSSRGLGPRADISDDADPAPAPPSPKSRKGPPMWSNKPSMFCFSKLKHANARLSDLYYAQVFGGRNELLGLSKRTLENYQRFQKREEKRIAHEKRRNSIDGRLVRVVVLDVADRRYQDRS